jgi:GAF domain-containing protein
MSATPDSTLADSIADLRRKLAECEAERDAALAREAAITEVLGVINSSPGDLAPVFDEMLERAMRLCGAAFGVFAIYDSEHYQVVATNGLPLELAEFVSQAVRIHPGSMPDRLRRGENTIQVLDITALGSELRTPGLVAMIELGKARTAVWLALRKDGIAQGFIGVYRQDVRPFSDKQIALLQNFAAQAVIAMENARLLTETREALEQQTATAEVLQVINSSPGDLTPIFDAMLGKAMDLCEAAFGGLFALEGEQFHAVATRGLPGSLNDFVRQGFTADQSNPLLRGAMIDHIVDLSERPLDKPGLRAAVELGGARTMLNAALRKDDAMLGSFSIFRREVRPFSDKQIALLQNFAAQAVIAMENARLVTETREALAQQTATAEVLQVINSSPGDLAPVFDAMLEKAHALCGVDAGVLGTYDGERFQAVATRGLPEQIDILVRQPFIAAPATPHDRLVRGETLVEVIDLATAEWHHDDPKRQAALEAGIRTLLYVPLRKDGSLLGYFTANRWELRPFTPREIALLENFAAQAVIAMENARLLNETREALEQQTATAEVLQVINSSPGHLAPVFEAMLDKALQLCEAKFGNIMTYDGENFKFAATAGHFEFDKWLRQNGPGRPGPGTTMDRMIRGDRVIHIADMADDDPYRAGTPIRRGLVEIGGFRTLLAVALHKDHALLGSFHIFRQEVRPFSDKQIALLQNFAAQAVIAMENARLLGELRERTDEIAGWNRELQARVAEQVEELGRVGRLKRFLAPQLAELIVSQGDEKILESHRREIVVVFCDLRGYTAFTETASLKKCSTSCANTTARWGRWSASSRARSTSSRATGSWCSSTTPSLSQTLPSVRSRWRWRCARRQAR